MLSDLFEVGAMTPGSTTEHKLFSVTHPDVDESDVPADEDVLTFDIASGKWKAKPPAAWPLYAPRVYTWTILGAALETGDEQGPVYKLDEEFTLLDVVVGVGTAPTGAAIIMDIEKASARSGAWTTIFSTLPEIDAGAQEDDGNYVFDQSAIAAGQWIRANIDQVGSTVAGEDLTIHLVGKVPVEIS